MHANDGNRNFSSIIAPIEIRMNDIHKLYSKCSPLTRFITLFALDSKSAIQLPSCFMEFAWNWRKSPFLDEYSSDLQYFERYRYLHSQTYPMLLSSSPLHSNSKNAILCHTTPHKKKKFLLRWRELPQNDTIIEIFTADYSRHQT